MTINRSTRGRMVNRSLSLKSPFGCILSDLKVPEFNKAISALDTSNITSVTKFPKIKSRLYYVLKIYLIHFLCEFIPTKPHLWCDG